MAAAHSHILGKVLGRPASVGRFDNADSKQVSESCPVCLQQIAGSDGNRQRGAGIWRCFYSFREKEAISFENPHVVVEVLQVPRPKACLHPAEPNTALVAARSTMRNAIAAANGYIDQANADVTAAYTIADSLASGACAGQGPGTPPPAVTHLH